MTILHNADVKSEVKGPERLTSHDKNIASARPKVCKSHGKYMGKDAPNSNNNCTIEMTKKYGDRDSQCGGRRLDIATATASTAVGGSTTIMAIMKMKS